MAVSFANKTIELRQVRDERGTRMKNEVGSPDCREPSLAAVTRQYVQSAPKERKRREIQTDAGNERD